MKAIISSKTEVNVDDDLGFVTMAWTSSSDEVHMNILGLDGKSTTINVDVECLTSLQETTKAMLEQIGKFEKKKKDDDNTGSSATNSGRKVDRSAGQSKGARRR